ncbi:hypothetical protein H2198_003444 [Neophaeococcomyces mojaviensis]|uniref:Uncharacterized protein n=1 Tax=Neophaeococcomyces mojaviensis TaxID=3383035 RepID=A0ACC3ABQ7_9EURO|nr:hypothetical protein H2198_003444 [Knufia sp. JES_112]
MSPKPIVAGHIFIKDPALEHVKPAVWNTIPNIWKKIRFDAMNVLYISPFSVLPNKGFGLIPQDGQLDALEKRFEWVVARARELNPDIKIIVMNMYGCDEGFNMLTSDYEIDVYTSSVAAFMDSWHNRTLTTDSGKTVPGHIDGYDIDYEAATVVENAGAVLTSIRTKLYAVSNKYKISEFQVSASSDRTTYLEKMAPVLNYVNMQNYDGGARVDPLTYRTQIKGIQYTQLLRGISSEKMEPVNRPETLDAIKKQDLKLLLKVDNTHSYAGVMVWRLNSDNWVYENAFQVMLYNQIHGTSLAQLPDFAFADNATIYKGWDGKGRDAHGNLTGPWTGFPYD